MNSFGKLVDKFSDNPNWKISKSTIYYKKVVWIPICTERNETLFIYLSKQIRKEVILIVKLIDEKDEFYLISPIFSNPKYKYIDEDFHKLNIENYLGNYVDFDFYFSFKSNNFDLIENMVKYCKNYDCFDLIKEKYDQINSVVQKETHDWYNTQSYYEFCIEIREDFSNLYREIRLLQILN